MISFIVPAHNEEALIGATVNAIVTAARAVNQPFEVIVSCDACTDRTAELATAAGARAVHVDKRQIAAVRNAGAREAKGDIFVFVDADTLLNQNVLRAALTALERGAVGGGALVLMDQKLTLSLRFFMLIWDTLSRVARYAAGCFVFVRRADFEAVGGFDERFYASEEIWLSRALKQRGRFVVLHERVVTSGRKLRMYGAGELFGLTIKLLWKGPKSWQKRDDLGLWYDGKRETSDTRRF